MRSNPRLALGLAGAVVTTIMISSASAACTREALLAAATKYIAAQEEGKLNFATLPPAANLGYKENNAALDIKKGLLARPVKIDYHRATADSVQCASYTEWVATTGPAPFVVGTQITHNPQDMSVVLIDTIAASTGSLFFNASQTLAHLKAEDWSPLPPEKRPTRELLRGTIDGYLDMWTNATAIDAIPWGTPCQRVEGSRLVTPCTAGAPRGGSNRTISMRRYVIDEVMGSGNALCDFTAMGHIPDSHEVRIESGKVRYVHTITLSMNGTGGPVPLTA